MSTISMTNLNDSSSRGPLTAADLERPATTDRAPPARPDDDDDSLAAARGVLAGLVLSVAIAALAIVAGVALALAG